MTYYFVMLWLRFAMSYVSTIVVVDYKELMIVITASSTGVFVLGLMLFYGDKT